MYELAKENYLTKTKKDKRYSAVGKDQCKRDFAVCPVCDNPIQIIGVYKKLENTDKPYGRHYNHDTAIAKHNEQAYQFCPYASNHYDVTRDMKKEKMTDYERDIYRSTRNNFDLAVAILESDLGILVTKNMAEHMLKEYVASNVLLGNIIRLVRKAHAITVFFANIFGQPLNYNCYSLSL